MYNYYLKKLTLRSHLITPTRLIRIYFIPMFTDFVHCMSDNLANCVHNLFS